MTKTLTMMMGAALLLAGTQAVYAQGYSSCARDAADQRAECLRDGARDRARVAECSADYRDDVAECRRYEHRPVVPMRRPPPPPQHR